MFGQPELDERLAHGSIRSCASASLFSTTWVP